MRFSFNLEWTLTVRTTGDCKLNTLIDRALLNYSSKALSRQLIDPNGIEIVRLLAQAQDILSASDISRLYVWNDPECVEFLLSDESVQYELRSINDEPYIFPLLSRALRGYVQSAIWERAIRMILRTRANPHSPVDDFLLHITDGISTLLDALFEEMDTPFRAKEVADGWLQILASEGFDVLAYLEEERTLHALQEQFTYPVLALDHYELHYELPRKLFFELEGKPSVSWDWWIDPASSAYLVREEFKYTNLFHADSIFYLYQWEEFWPFHHPEWSELREPWKQLHKQAQRRAERRLKKKALKMARTQGIKARLCMPGAWPV